MRQVSELRARGGRGLRCCPQGGDTALHVLWGLWLTGPWHGVQGFGGRSALSES